MLPFATKRSSLGGEATLWIKIPALLRVAAHACGARRLCLRLLLLRFRFLRLPPLRFLLARLRLQFPLALLRRSRFLVLRLRGNLRGSLRVVLASIVREQRPLLVEEGGQGP